MNKITSKDTERFINQDKTNTNKIKSIFSISLNIKEGTTILELIQELNKLKYKYDDLVIPTQTTISLGNLTATEFERFYNE